MFRGKTMKWAVSGLVGATLGAGIVSGIDNARASKASAAIADMEVVSAASRCPALGGMENAVPVNDAVYVPESSATDAWAIQTVQFRRPGGRSSGSLRASLDALYVVKQSDGNLSEVATGQMALQKSANPSIRMVAQVLVEEHGMAQAQLAQLAQNRGYPLPPGPGVMHQMVAQRLATLSGAEFDRMWIAAQMEAHENTITLLLTEINHGSDPVMRAYAARVLPSVVAHTQHIYDVAHALNAPGAALRPARVPAG